MCQSVHPFAYFRLVLGGGTQQASGVNEFDSETALISLLCQLTSHEAEEPLRVGAFPFQHSDEVGLVGAIKVD